MEVLQGIKDLFYEISVELSYLDSILTYFQEDCRPRENSLEYLLYFHNFDSAESAKVLKEYPELKDEFYESLNRIFILMGNRLGGKARGKLFARPFPILIIQIDNTVARLGRLIKRKDAARQKSKSRS